MGHFRSDQIREIRLNETEWGIFEQLGGVSWLKRCLRNRHIAGVAKRERNNRIRKDRLNGMSDAAVAEKYGIARATVWRIRNERG